MQSNNTITEEDLYHIEIILSRSKIDQDAFFSIMRLLKITDRKEEFKFLNYIINLNPSQLEKLAEDIARLKKYKQNWRQYLK